MPYLKLPSKKLTASGTLSQGRKAISNGGFTYSRNEVFQVSFQLCSTKLAQNGKEYFMLASRYHCLILIFPSQFVTKLNQLLCSDKLKLTILFIVDLLGLLKWRSQKDKLPTILPALMKVSGEEIVKVFHWL